MLSNEKEALGLYLTGHPFDAVRNDAGFFVDGRLADITAEPPPQNSTGWPQLRAATSRGDRRRADRR